MKSSSSSRKIIFIKGNRHPWGLSDIFMFSIFGSHLHVLHLWAGFIYTCLKLKSWHLWSLGRIYIYMFEIKIKTSPNSPSGVWVGFYRYMFKIYTIKSLPIRPCIYIGSKIEARRIEALTLEKNWWLSTDYRIAMTCHQIIDLNFSLKLNIDSSSKLNLNLLLKGQSQLSVEDSISPQWTHRWSLASTLNWRFDLNSASKLDLNLPSNHRSYLTIKDA